MSNAIKYVWQGQELEISPEIVRRFISTSSNVNEQEIKDFMDLCIYQHLNPFIKEAYLIKYGNERANIVTSKDVFDKRAFRDPKYDGEEVTTNYKRGMNLMDLWVRTRIYHKDLSHPASDVTIYYPEYVGKKKDGTINRMWKSKPMTMLTKVSKAQGKREANPEDLARLYLTEEFDQQSRPTETDIREKDITPKPKQLDKPNDDLASDKQILLIQKQIIASHLLKKAELEKMSKLIEGGMTKSKASEIIGWWLDDKATGKIGERTKRETAEKQAKTKAKEEPKDDKDIEFPFNKDDGLEINDPNAPEIDAKEKPRKAHKVSKAEDFIPIEELGGVVEVAPGVKVAELDTF